MKDKLAMENEREVELSIVIISWNVAEYLLACVQSIYKTLEGVEFEVIVVDNNSSDNSVSCISSQFPGVKIIKNRENRGFGIANNQGVHIAKGKYLLLLNPDTLLTAGTVKVLLTQLQADESIGIIAPQQVGEDGRVVANFSQVNPEFILNKTINLFIKKVFKKENYFLLSKRIEVKWLNAAIFLMRRSVYNKIEGFNEELFLNGEEIEFCQKVRELQLKIIYDRRYYIIHFSGKSFEQLDNDGPGVLGEYRIKSYLKSLQISIKSQLKRKKFFAVSFWIVVWVVAGAILVIQVVKRKKRKMSPQTSS